MSKKIKESSQDRKVPVVKVIKKPIKNLQKNQKEVVSGTNYNLPFTD